MGVFILHSKGAERHSGSSIPCAHSGCRALLPYTQSVFSLLGDWLVSFSLKMDLPLFPFCQKVILSKNKQIYIYTYIFLPLYINIYLYILLHIIYKDI